MSCNACCAVTRDMQLSRPDFLPFAVHYYRLVECKQGSQELRLCAHGMSNSDMAAFTLKQ